jgi:hypothetical protein
MAICDYCQQEMLGHVGCKPWPELQRIPYGSEMRFPEPRPLRASWPNIEAKTCHDCGAGDGELHHPGCDMEECPMCGRQSISCGCRWPGEREVKDD